jgi:hypothetical protein
MESIAPAGGFCKFLREVARAISRTLPVPRVTLSEAKGLPGNRGRCFAALSMTMIYRAFLK